MKIKLIIDSTSQIPVEFAKKNNIALIEPLIDLDGEYRKEISEVDREDFVSRMRDLNPLPKTTIASPQHVLELFEQIVKEGYEEAIYLYVTPELSNQISPVKVAEKKIKDKLKVHLYATSYGGPPHAPFGLYAAKLLDEGKSSKEIMKALDKMKDNIYSIGISTSFDILFRTGKIKKSVKMTLISKLMNLKPLYESTKDKGFAGSGAGAGYGGAIKKLLEAVEEKTNPDVEYNVIMNHVQNEKLAKKIENAVKNIRKVNEVMYAPLSPCVANSLGYGTAAITLYPVYEALK